MKTNKQKNNIRKKRL